MARGVRGREEIRKRLLPRERLHRLGPRPALQPAILPEREGEADPGDYTFYKRGKIGGLHRLVLRRLGKETEEHRVQRHQLTLGKPGDHLLALIPEIQDR